MGAYPAAQECGWEGGGGSYTGVYEPVGEPRAQGCRFEKATKVWPCGYGHVGAWLGGLVAPGRYQGDRHMFEGAGEDSFINEVCCLCRLEASVQAQVKAQVQAHLKLHFDEERKKQAKAEAKKIKRMKKRKLKEAKGKVKKGRKSKGAKKDKEAEAVPEPVPGINTEQKLIDMMTNIFRESTKSSRTCDLGDEINDMGAKLAKKAKAKFNDKKAPYIPLGSLVRPRDPKFSDVAPMLSMALDSATNLKSVQRFRSPRTWDHFLVLLDRLKLGLICGAGRDKIDEIQEYFERLVEAKTQQLASPLAVINFDERNRRASSGSWKWLVVDTLLFFTCVAEFPITLPAEPVTGAQPRASGRDRPKDRGPKDRGQSGPVPAAARLNNGLCRRFDKDDSCTFQNCRFAHHCVKRECNKNGFAEHKSKDCSKP